MRHSFLLGLVPALAFAATLATTKEAHASPRLDLDLDLGTAFGNNVDFSYGGGLRFGYRIPLYPSVFYLQPELGGHYMRFGTNSAGVGGYDYAGTLNGGLKLGIQGIVQPNVFAHLGLGMLGYNIDATTTEFYVGPQADIGVGLDIMVAPGFSLGGQIAYNSAAVLSNQNVATAAKWASFGLTAGFSFGDAPRRRAVYVYR